MAKSTEDRERELREQGMSAAQAKSQAFEDAANEVDREWREQGLRESGGSREGWNL